MDKSDPRGLYEIYKEPNSNGYGKDLAKKRFEILKGHTFHSVLDVGSGPCYLHEWLRENKPNVLYEAVDIRPETLKLCNCCTYEKIPQNKKYDLVCLFGTITYNIDGDELKNKAILKSLLREAKEVCNSVLFFTVFKDKAKAELRTFMQDRFVYFSEAEVGNLLASLGISKFHIAEYDKIDKYEYFVTCRLD